jgi:chemotaxis protein CheD
MLGVGDLGATHTAGSELKTLALGSCVAVIFLDPNTRTIGMAHVALPESKANPGRAKERPGYFADTGIPVLMKEMAKLGCDETGKGWIVKLVGGANVADPNNTFNIGKRNVLAIKKILWQCRMGAVAEDVGKNYGRSVAVHVDTGRVTVTSPGRGDWQI